MKIKNKKLTINCLIVTSEPYYWQEIVEHLVSLGIVVTQVVSIEEAVKILAKNNFNFAIINNTMFGPIPNSPTEIDQFTAGMTYTSKYLEKKDIPFILLSTIYRDEIKKFTSKNCIHNSISSDVYPKDIEEILKNNKLI